MSDRLMLSLQSGLFGSTVMLTIQAAVSGNPWEAPVVLFIGSPIAYFAWMHFQRVQDKPRTTESKVEA